ncbi:hypothetical protein GCM10020367_14130 [Streptomyces sannanensis]|uniref:Uncharacterized protein n=1 Tax=Streptomyces sannanensis TaxID=285536 RepID=A0ABP6S744_9ACTN
MHLVAGQGVQPPEQPTRVEDRVQPLRQLRRDGPLGRLDVGQVRLAVRQDLGEPGEGEARLLPASEQLGTVEMPGGTARGEIARLGHELGTPLFSGCVENALPLPSVAV